MKELSCKLRMWWRLNEKPHVEKLTIDIRQVETIKSK